MNWKEEEGDAVVTVGLVMVQVLVGLVVAAVMLGILASAVMYVLANW
jgi:hypothetical protein